MQYLSLALFALLCLMGLARPLWALVLLLVMFALKVSLLAGFDAFRAQSTLLNFVVAGVVLVATTIALLKHPRPLLGHLTAALAIVLALLGWSILSLLWSPAQSNAVNEGFNIVVEGYPYFIIFVVMGPILVASVQEWRRATSLMLVMGSLVALSILASPEFTLRMGRIGVGFDGVTRTSPLAIAAMGGMLAIFGALSAGGRVTGLQTAVRVAAFIIGALLALFSGTRGQSVFALITIAIFLPASRRLKNLGSYLSLAGAGLVVAVGAYFAFNFVLGRTDIDRWQSSAIVDAAAVRQWTALLLLTEFIQSPQSWIIGLGYNAFSALEGVGDLGYVHNLFVEVLCELGVPMFALMVTLMVWAGRASMSLFRHYREHPAERSAVSILMAMVFYNALIMAKEGNLWSAWNFFAFMLIIIRLDVRTRVLGDDSLEEEFDEALDAAPSETSDASDRELVAAESHS